ncbi:hypothetical protein AAGF08_20490, partial [Algoriphagus sp. SE2]|uniref:hypothetical protein n=1 Tax=Algoriphagus sp. SE2 TaxID=3141536 RepID=UPI0031CD40CB
FEGGFRVMEDHSHNIWLTHNSGGQFVLSVIGEGREDYVEILNDRVSYFFQDSNHSMWLAAEKGLMAISLEEKTAVTIDKKKGNLGWQVLFEEDRHGRLWVIKNDTIEVLSKDRRQMKTIVTNRPIRWGNTIKDKRGIIWIGTTEGILL